MVSLDGEPLHEVNEFKVEGLKPGVHDLVLGAPSQNSEVSFRGLQLSQGATTLPVEARPIIEWIGDSITTGGGQTRPSTINYAWQTAERLAADHTQIAFSGRALTTGYVCGEDKAALDTQYFQIKSFNHLKDGPQVARKVDYQPQIVVINLGQNDQCAGEPPATFQASYEGFIKKIRAQLPLAHIVALRPFGGPYEKSVHASVEATNAAGEQKVTFVDTTGWLQAADYVDGTHPTEAGHDKVAAKLVPILRPLLTAS
jgi:lysophospholipase L1-like esterase